MYSRAIRCGELDTNPQQPARRFALAGGAPRNYTYPPVGGFSPAFAETKRRLHAGRSAVVSRLTDEGGLNPGEHSVVFSAKSLASGVYLYRLTAGTFVQQKKMAVIK